MRRVIKVMLESLLRLSYIPRLIFCNFIFPINSLFHERCFKQENHVYNLLKEFYVWMNLTLMCMKKLCNMKIQFCRYVLDVLAFFKAVPLHMENYLYEMEGQFPCY